MGRGDPNSATRLPGRKNGTSRPGRDVLVRDGGPGVELAGHLLLPYEPIHPLNLLYLLFYNILKILSGSKNLHIDQWITSHFKKNDTVCCVLAQKFPEPLQLLYGSRSSSPTRCRINACVLTSTFGSRDYHWSPTVAWWPLVPIGIMHDILDCEIVCLFVVAVVVFHIYSYIVRNINCSE